MYVQYIRQIFFDFLNFLVFFFLISFSFRWTKVEEGIFVGVGAL